MNRWVWPVSLVAIASGLFSVASDGPTAVAAVEESRDLPEVRGLDGRKLPLRAGEGGVTALVFYSSECPISNAYSPTLNAIAEEFSGAHVQLVGLCVDPDLSDAELSSHASEYGLRFPLARDRDGGIARRLGVKTTPEAVVLDGAGRVRYRGRIDDQFAARQKRNANPKTHELRDAIAAVLDGREVPQAQVEAVGCPLPEPPAARPVPTFSGEVAGILKRNCVECHRTGQVGPFPLTTYEQARKRADDLASVVEDRRMPPWKPEPGVGPGFQHDKSLTEAEVAAVVGWAEAGAPLGDASAVPSLEVGSSDGWKLGTPDLILTTSEGYEVDASGEDDYRCFVIPTDLPEDVAISAIEYLPGNRRVVHHILAYVDTSGEARKKDAADPGEGYSCFSGPGVEIHGDLGGWAPGNEPQFLPAGVGRILPKGADVIIQMHYHPSGKAETDSSRIGLYFSKAPIKQTLQWTAAVQYGLRLPPGEKDIEVRAEMDMPVDVVAYAVTPHMHLLGKDMRVSVETPDGETRDLIRIGDWDFNWQNSYYFKQPIPLPKGTRLKVLAHFDNSAENPRNPNSPPKEVRWGEATTDEMCIGFLAVTKAGQDLTRPGEKDDLREIFQRHYKELERKAKERQERAKAASGSRAEAK